MPCFVDVILPLPLPGTFTYRVSETQAPIAQVGSRVVVQFGAKRCYTAIVMRQHEEPPQGGYDVKEVLEVFDERPIVQPIQLKLWQWIADYYMCPIGDVYKAAVPSGLKIESQSIDKLREAMAQSYKPRHEAYVRLTKDYLSEEAFEKALASLHRAAKQKQLLLMLRTLASGTQGVTRSMLLQESGATAAILNGLVDKGFAEVYAVEVSRLGNGGDTDKAPCLSPLSAHQQRAFNEINTAWDNHDVCLLHGVTSSGKTEVYTHLIGEQLKQGRQVLYLVPEIALTQQMTERLRRVFGARLGVYHSKFSDAERVEIWQKQLSSEPYEVILGVRSSVFLPFDNLGLIIVDEEHESTYKQQDPAPRYHARSVAVMLAAYHKGKTLLGTATPSIESYYNAKCGKYGLAQMTERFSQVQLPHIEVVDVKEESRKKRMYGPFSTLLHDTIREALEQRKQVILFQNRRGYAPMLECAACGWVPKCDRCDVSLTYHREANRLECHYCGNVYSLPAACPSCGTKKLSKFGMGTERIEEEVQRFFPTARVARLDLDTTRTKTAYDAILSDFQQGRTDVLIGTQMVSKGLDFDNVHAVGIMNADTMLNFPDFRSHERSFQLMAQVAGRAGRRGKQGVVILQTRNVDLPVIQQVVAHNYEGIYADQVGERELFGYPPFCRLIYIYIKGRYERDVAHTAEAMGNALKRLLGNRVLGPEAPAVARVQSLHIRKIMLKAEQAVKVAQVRRCLREIEQELSSQGLLNTVALSYDVDPY